MFIYQRVCCYQLTNSIPSLLRATLFGSLELHHHHSLSRTVSNCGCGPRNLALEPWNFLALIKKKAIYNYYNNHHQSSSIIPGPFFHSLLSTSKEMARNDLCSKPSKAICGALEQLIPIWTKHDSHGSKFRGLHGCTSFDRNGHCVAPNHFMAQHYSAKPTWSSKSSSASNINLIKYHH
jgi:hypothetical protein